MIYSDDVVAITRLIRSVMQEGEEYRIAYPKVFACPVCKHQTLSDTRSIKDNGGKQLVRYCFGCGNTFSKQVLWKQSKEKKQDAG